MCLFYFLLVYILCSLYLPGIEYDASGTIECEEVNWCKYDINFSVSVKDNKWCIRYLFNRPKDLTYIKYIDSRYDGKYNYTLRTIKSKVDSNEFTGANIHNSEYFQQIENGGDVIWLALCSRRYFTLLTNNMIFPFITCALTKSQILSQTNNRYRVSAYIRYLNETNRIPKLIEYNIWRERMKYELLEFTNINNNIIPIKARATILYNNSLDPSNPQYYPSYIYSLYINSIVLHCSITNFKPLITNNISIADERFDGIEEMPSDVTYYSTNWLSDKEFTNHPAFIEELKRYRQTKQFDEFLTRRVKYGKIAFFTLFFISTIPLGYLIYRYKIRGKRVKT